MCGLRRRIMNRHSADLIKLITAHKPLAWTLTDEDMGADAIPQAYAQGRPLPIWSGASDGSIWGEPRYNWILRGFHDSVHIRYGCDFTLEGELKASRIQAELARDMGLDELAQIMVWETAGQAVYYDRTGQFPPQSFTLDRMRAAL